MIGGAHGEILHVDLSSGETHLEHPADDVYRLLVGGRAIVAYLLRRDLAPQTDPFSPENLLIFAPGLMQGSNFPGAGRHAVGAKSPLTGPLGSSEVGGWWGHEFKRTGFDALVIRGRAPSPVYLWIKNGQVEIRPVDHLWGLATKNLICRCEFPTCPQPRRRLAPAGARGSFGEIDIERGRSYNVLGCPVDRPCMPRSEGWGST